MALTTILPSALNATQTFSMANLVVAGNITAGNISGAASGLTSIPAANVTGNLSGVANITASGSVTLSGGTANGVAYLNGSKVLTTGSALTFDGSNLTQSGPADAVSLTVNTQSFTVSANNYSEIRLADFGSVRTYWRNMRDGSGATIFSGGNHIRFALSGTEQMRLTSTGLGIGTSSPTNKLDVSTDAVIRAGTSGTPSTGGTLWLTTGTSTGGVRSAGIRAVSTGTSNNHNLVFLTNTDSAAPTEVMRLDASGNLGLGVTPSAWSASAKALQIGAYSAVYQNASGYPELTFNVYQNSSNIYTYQVSSNPATRFSQTNGAFQWFIAPSGTAGNVISFTQAMTLDASGKLLLGATSIAGSETLRVYNATNSRINIDQASNGIILGADASGPFIDTTGSNRLAVFIAGTERMRIDTAGRFMVGKTNTNELQAGGSGYFYVPGSQGFTSIVQTENSNNFLSYYNKVGTSGGFHIFLLNDSTVGSITTNGSSTAYNTSSDYRLKNITGPVTNSGAYIDSLNPVEGTWKKDGSTFVGLIAHEVQEVSRTQIATGEKDGDEMQALDYSAAEIIANLIAEVQSLRRRLAAAGL